MQLILIKELNRLSCETTILISLILLSRRIIKDNYYIKNEIVRNITIEQGDERLYQGNSTIFPENKSLYAQSSVHPQYDIVMERDQVFLIQRKGKRVAN